MRRRQVFQTKVEGPFGIGEVTLDPAKPSMVNKYVDPMVKCPKCERKFKKNGLKRHMGKCTVETYTFTGGYRDYDRTFVKRKGDD